jgi:UPF0755 protein
VSSRSGDSTGPRAPRRPLDDDATVPFSAVRGQVPSPDEQRARSAAVSGRPSERPPSRRPAERSAPPPKKKPARKKNRAPLLALGFLVVGGVLLGGFLLFYRAYLGAPDYDGPGQGDVIVQIRAGDTTRNIGEQLVADGVVRSDRAFTRAAADEARIRSVQPGYYRMRLRMSGDSAVALLMSPKTRVGQLDIKGGMQLDDTQGPNGTVSPGILSLVSKASCTELNGNSTCVSAAKLRSAMATTAPRQLGVPDWAVEPVSKADPGRRLEGLIAPGRYDVRPGAPPQEILRNLVTNSVNQYTAAGLVNLGGGGKYGPYELLIIASLVEREGIAPDFGKIAQVVYNRLSDRVRLELDSTVNYPLDRQLVRTNAADRARQGPYNSYLNYGLPPTPIGAPGRQAIDATLSPQPGPWMFFVRCQKSGVSCFSTTLSQHQQTVGAAIAAGAF